MNRLVHKVSGWIRGFLSAFIAINGTYCKFNGKYVVLINKNWCFWTMVLEKTLESPLDCKEIQPVHPKGDQFWVFIGRTDAEAETPILWPPDGKSWLLEKDPDAGRDWGQEEKGTTEDEMAGWHHQLHGHEFGQTLIAGGGQGGLACCDSWGHKESDTTERLNWTELNKFSREVVYAYQQCMRVEILHSFINGMHFLIFEILPVWKVRND